MRRVSAFYHALISFVECHLAVPADDLTPLCITIDESVEVVEYFVVVFYQYFSAGFQVHGNSTLVDHLLGQFLFFPSDFSYEFFVFMSYFLNRIFKLDLSLKLVAQTLPQSAHLFNVLLCLTHTIFQRLFLIQNFKRSRFLLQNGLPQLANSFENSSALILDLIRLLLRLNERGTQACHLSAQLKLRSELILGHMLLQRIQL